MEFKRTKPEICFSDCAEEDVFEYGEKKLIIIGMLDNNWRDNDGENEYYISGYAFCPNIEDITLYKIELYGCDEIKGKEPFFQMDSKNGLSTFYLDHYEVVEEDADWFDE